MGSSKALCIQSYDINPVRIIMTPNLCYHTALLTQIRPCGDALSRMQVTQQNLVVWCQTPYHWPNLPAPCPLSKYQIQNTRGKYILTTLV